jgi:hypothetical protein
MKRKLIPLLLILSSFFLFACGLTGLISGENNQPDDIMAPEVNTNQAETEETEPSVQAPDMTEPEETDPEPTVEEEEAATPENEADPQSACYHPFFPITEGASWTYQSTMGEAYTLNLSEVETDTFVMTQTLQDSDTTFTIDWYCSEDGILRGTFAQVDLLAETSGEETPEITFETLEWSGETLPDPAKWETGYTWTSEYQLAGEVNMEGVEATSEVTVSIEHTISGVETVELPAGRFEETFKVDSEGVIDMVMVMGETSTPVTGITFTYATWYVRDLGMIKSDNVFQGYTETTELIESSLLD